MCGVPFSTVVAQRQMLGMKRPESPNGRIERVTCICVAAEKITHGLVEIDLSGSHFTILGMG